MRLIHLHGRFAALGGATIALFVVLAQSASALNTGSTIAEAPSAAAGESVFRQIKWLDLVPKGRDPYKQFKGLNKG